MCHEDLAIVGPFLAQQFGEFEAGQRQDFVDMRFEPATIFAGDIAIDGDTYFVKNHSDARLSIMFTTTPTTISME